MLPTARPADPGRSAAARKRTVDRARELMHGSGDRSLSLLEVCKAVGASPRKLGYCFQEVLGHEPDALLARDAAEPRAPRPQARVLSRRLRRRRAARLLALQPVLARLQAPLLRAALGDAAAGAHGLATRILSGDWSLSVKSICSCPCMWPTNRRRASHAREVSNTGQMSWRNLTFSKLHYGGRSEGVDRDAGHRESRPDFVQVEKRRPVPAGPIAISFSRIRDS